jgi:microcystin-dependent protein
MTISSEVRKAGPFNGNDVADTFAFTFKVFTTADVLVVQADELGVETELDLGTDYTVSLNSNQETSPGGDVILTVPLPTDEKLVITSQVGNLQPVDLTNQGGFFPSVINAALDRLTIQIQQLAERVDRSAKLSITDAGDIDALLADVVVIADSLATVNAVAASIADISAVAGIEASVSAVAAALADIQAAVADLPSLAAKVNRSGDTFSGPVNVPAGATGTQVPQAQEIPSLMGITGQVAYFAVSSAPTGWLKANGALVSRTTYATLFAAVGTTFGVGDGSTTFALPDMRGEFPRGWDDGRGVDSGRVFGSAQLDQMQQITGSMGCNRTSGANLVGAFKSGGTPGASAAATGAWNCACSARYCLSMSSCYFI